MADIELDAEHQLRNNLVNSLSWESCSVQVPSKSSNDKSTYILRDVQGVAKAGSSMRLIIEMESCRKKTDIKHAGRLLALMGPSGSGKTTLLNVLARRVVGKNVRTEGRVFVNGHSCSDQTFRNLSSYVEQEDALIGSLTARETIDFCARLAANQ